MVFLLKRLASTAIVMLLVSLLVFMLLHLAPGDPAAVLAGDNASAEQIAQLRASLGLSEPLTTQFVRWLGLVLQGNLGQSIFSSEPVTLLIAQRAEPTLSIALATLAIAIPVALTLGVIAAHRVGTLTDRVLMMISVVGFSVPAFVVGYLLVYVFAVRLQWMPVQGYSPIADGVVQWATYLVLPALTLSLTYTALIARMTRATLLEVLSED